MEKQSIPEQGETDIPFYNCSECFEPIEIISIDDKNIKFKCYNDKNPHEKEIPIKEYINKMKPDIKIDICFIDGHNKKNEYYCIECRTHLCEDCIKQREHINHDKIIIKEISPNENELRLLEKIIEEYKDKDEDLKQLYELIYDSYKSFNNNYYFIKNINNILFNQIIINIIRVVYQM